MTIAFLGLGNMGGHMAANLVRAGHDVVGFDVAKTAAQAAAERGVRLAPSGPAAVAEAEVVFTMFPTGEHVLAAYRGDDGPALLTSAAPGTLFVDSSTIGVEEARTAARLAATAGHRALDAPVSGGTAGARAGSLTFMVGGSEPDVTSTRPLFETMGGRIVHCGDHGAGQAAKCCNNMLLAITTIGACEAFVLGENLGLTDQALFDVLSTSAAQCWSVTTNCPVPGPVPDSPAGHDYRPGFAASLMAKDLGLALGALDTTGTSAEFGRAAQQAYAAFTEAGHGDLDFSAIISTLRKDQA